jgi:hypothetical protein
LPATDAPRKLVLIVVDGLAAEMFESAVSSRATPALAYLAERGDYRRAVSTFPSLTPVCLSSIATGAHPDVHHIPHLVWLDRADGRIVEYGSSFAAVVAAGLTRSLLNTIVNMNARHLSPDAVTVFEALEDAGYVPASVNFTCYRGRTLHRPTVPGLWHEAHGPRRFFFYNLFESDVTGAPLAVRRRSAGSIDTYASAVGRWLVTRDGFDFFVFYLSDYDYASHAVGPGRAHESLARSDAAIGALMDAAGGWETFLERYAVVVCADHGQTHVERSVALEDAFRDLSLLRRGGREPADVAVTASNRAGMVYRLAACRETADELAARLDDDPAVGVALYREEDEAVARREGAELRFSPALDGWRTSGDPTLLDHPEGLERAWAALANPNAGDVLVSAAAGYEFRDLGGRDHVGGGSHGSLVAGDSLVPMLTVGTGPAPTSITGIAPLVLRYFGVDLPPYARELADAA